MTPCKTCGVEFPQTTEYFYERTTKGYRYLHVVCKGCHNAQSAQNVAAHRVRTKAKLMTLKGNKCHDCGITGPQYLFDFDHRVPADKLFNLSNQGLTKRWPVALAEAEKCDLVCANCHRHRTHAQYCPGSCRQCDSLPAAPD